MVTCKALLFCLYSCIETSANAVMHWRLFALSIWLVGSNTILCVEGERIKLSFYRFTLASLLSGMCSMRFIGGRGGRLNDVEARLKLC